MCGRRLSAPFFIVNFVLVQEVPLIGDPHIYNQEGLIDEFGCGSVEIILAILVITRGWFDSRNHHHCMQDDFKPAAVHFKETAEATEFRHGKYLVPVFGSVFPCVSPLPLHVRRVGAG